MSSITLIRAGRKSGAVSRRTRQAGVARRKSSPAVIAALAVCTIALSACGAPSASTSSQGACPEVAKSISLYQQSLSQPAPLAAQSSAKAAADLLTALHLATTESLQETLAQAGQLSGVSGAPDHTTLNEGVLVTALQAECA
jgi:hypothetical protein